MPRRANPEIRTRLLSLGSDLVRRQGFNATGVQDIAAAAAVPKGSFYSYFKSKDAFAGEILDVYWTMIAHDYGPILHDATVRPIERIERHFSALIALHAQSGFQLGCLIGNLALEISAASPEARAKLAAIIQAWSDLLLVCLREAKRRGEIPRGRNLEQLARALIDSFEGAVMSAKVEQGATPLSRFRDLTLPALLRK